MIAAAGLHLRDACVCARLPMDINTRQPLSTRRLSLIAAAWPLLASTITHGSDAQCRFSHFFQLPPQEVLTGGGKRIIGEVLKRRSQRLKQRSCRSVLE